MKVRRTKYFLFHSSLSSFTLPKQAVAIPYSSGQSFTHLTKTLQGKKIKDGRNPLFIRSIIHTLTPVQYDRYIKESRNPLFIRSIIHTRENKCLPSGNQNVAIPYSSGQSFTPHNMTYFVRVQGINVAIPYSSGQSFTQIKARRVDRKVKSRNPLFIRSIIHTAPLLTIRNTNTCKDIFCNLLFSQSF